MFSAAISPQAQHDWGTGPVRAADSGAYQGPRTSQPGRMDASGARVHVWNALSSMCAAALPARSEDWRQMSETDQRMVALVRKDRFKEPIETSEPQTIQTGRKWNIGSWDAFEYRANAPSLAQYDRDKSTRAKRDVRETGNPNLITVGTKRKAKRPQDSPRQHTGSAETQKGGIPSGNGSNDGRRKSKALRNEETKVPLGELKYKNER
eukprot:s2755_g3.t1